ncbi:hypothetical protein [Pandoraea pnomenusa]|nr:hypothetical protein [Pandoraea pnomenusa]
MRQDADLVDADARAIKAAILDRTDKCGDRFSIVRLRKQGFDA